MNKEILFSICLILVAIIGFGCVSAADAHNTTMGETPSVTVEQQQNMDMIQNHIIDTEKTVKEGNKTSKIIETGKENIKIEQNLNTGTQVNDINNNSTNNSTQPTLDIKGPKINNETKNIKGPKGVVKIGLPQIKKDIFHYARIYREHPEWDMFECVNYVFKTAHYTWGDTVKIISQAHNIAFHKYNGSDMVINKDLSEHDIHMYLLKHMYFWLEYGGRG
ncbi:MAG: hypothetical protein Q4Q22_05185 [Methanosphaera sp.]|nr:hypothetical protein [Methanosphaera sp.]